MKMDVTAFVMKQVQKDRLNIAELAHLLDMSSVHFSDCLRGAREMAPEKVSMLEKKLKIKLPDKMKIKGK